MKNDLRKHLAKLIKIKRHKYHPLIHNIHKHHKISKKTLFYIKEYGPHSNVPKTIIKESIKVLLLASIISSIGGLFLENIKTLFVSIMPLVILFPVLNDMIGDYGSVISSRFSTMIHEGKVKNPWKNHPEIKKLFLQIMLSSVLTLIISITLAITISIISGYNPTKEIIIKIFLIDLIDIIILISLISFIALFMGFRIYKKGEDPNNFLIPITTSIADFGNMVIIAVLITLFF